MIDFVLWFPSGEVGFPAVVLIYGVPSRLGRTFSLLIVSYGAAARAADGDGAARTVVWNSAGRGCDFVVVSARVFCSYNKGNLN